MRRPVKYPKRRITECPFCHGHYMVRRVGSGTVKTYRDGRGRTRIERDFEGRPRRDYYYVGEEPHDCEEGRKVKAQMDAVAASITPVINRVLRETRERRHRR